MYIPDTIYAEYSLDGLLLVTVSNDNRASIRNAETGALVNVLVGHDERINVARFSPYGARVVTGSSDNTAIVWDVASGKKVVQFTQHHDDIFNANFSFDSQWLVTISAGDIENDSVQLTLSYR